MKKILILLVISCFIFSCVENSIEIDYETSQNTPPGTPPVNNNGNVEFSYVCSSIAVNGGYKQGVTLGSTNSVTVKIIVTKLGKNNTYNISTSTVNGYQFSDTGEFNSLGSKTIRLQASGTPVASEVNTFQLANCSFQVNIVADGNDNGGGDNGGDSNVQVGKGGCGSSISSRIPAQYSTSTFDKPNTWSLFIFQNTDINRSGNIESISFLTDCTVTSACTGIEIPNQKIYMKMIDASTSTLPYSSAPIQANLASSWTLVKDGTIQLQRGKVGGDKYSKITLDQKFKYNKANDLLIFVVNKSNRTGAGNCYGSFDGSPAFIVDAQGPKNSNYALYNGFENNQKPEDVGGYSSNQIPVTRLEIN